MLKQIAKRIGRTIRDHVASPTTWWSLLRESVAEQIRKEISACLMGLAAVVVILCALVHAPIVTSWAVTMFVFGLFWGK